MLAKGDSLRPALQKITKLPPSPLRFPNHLRVFKLPVADTVIYCQLFAVFALVQICRSSTKLVNKHTRTRANERAHRHVKERMCNIATVFLHAHALSVHATQHIEIHFPIKRVASSAEVCQGIRKLRNDALLNL